MRFFRLPSASLYSNSLKNFGININRSRGCLIPICSIYRAIASLPLKITDLICAMAMACFCLRIVADILLLLLLLFFFLVFLQNNLLLSVNSEESTMAVNLTTFPVVGEDGTPGYRRNSMRVPIWCRLGVPLCRSEGRLTGTTQRHNP